ncbi:MAG: carboxypeptidase-like regulatory domain-containing protein [bacterium]|nr:carboxypeptidase-like regulatory domain-containing protein [bacterium]
MTLRKVYLSLLFLVAHGQLMAQTNVPPLERVISLELKGQNSREALMEIEPLVNVSFTYRSALVPANDRLQRTYIEKTVREVLDDLFQGRLIYVERGDYIALKAAPVQKPTELITDGYIIDALTKEKIPYASVYDSTSLEATISDEYGYYTITIPKRENIELKAAKYGYRDTSVVLKSEGGSQNVYLMPTEEMIDRSKDSADFEEKVKRVPLIKLSKEQKATIENIKENFRKSAQVSLLPIIGTNGVMSPSTTVDYSFNILGGLNGGVRVAEIGGIFNTVWDTVKYVQVAGVFNAVGGPQYGAQVAGVMNLNASSFEGAQVSGVLNLTQGPFEGAQVAGIGSGVFGSFDGAQVSGIAGYVGAESDVVQVNGIAGYVGNDSRGAQISGISNVAEKNFIGSQVAGISNYARDGFIGTQFAGIVNVAGKMTGSQIGLINVNDSINGVPFGFISFSRKGLHQLELSSNELTHVNVAFKTGTNQFYNSFIGAARFESERSPTWGIGYGVGSSVRARKKNRVFFDLQSVNHFRDNQWGLALNNKLTISYQMQLAPKIALAVGPSANLFLIDNASSHDVTYLSGIAPYTIYDETTASGLRMQSWVGGHVALRLF